MKLVLQRFGVALIFLVIVQIFIVSTNTHPEVIPFNAVKAQTIAITSTTDSDIGFSIPDPALLEPITTSIQSANLTVEGPTSNPASITKMKTLNMGDDFIHGLIYFDGYLWASTRTKPARILKIEPGTLTYQRIILTTGLNEGDSIVAAAGSIWVGLNTRPAKLIKVDPETLQWNVAIQFNEMTFANSLEYSFGYLWVGGYDRKIARVDLTNLSYNIYSFPSVTDAAIIHSLEGSKDYLWGNAVHQSFSGIPYASTIVRVNPNNPNDYTVKFFEQYMPDDMGYMNDYLYVGGEEAPSDLYKVAADLTFSNVPVATTPSYGTFINPFNSNLVYGSYIGSPGMVIAVNPDLSVALKYLLPNGYNDANETVFDEAGNMYVTAWQRPAKLVKFGPVVTVGTAPFLDLPIAYSSTCFAQEAKGNIPGKTAGRVNSWFDHSYPTYCSPPNANGYDEKGDCITPNNNLTRWNGEIFNFTNSSPHIGESWYEGHNGIDFQHDHTQKNEPIFPAAPGKVFKTVTTCSIGMPNCGNGYGNQIWIDHNNGYATLYGHLKTVSVSPDTQIVDRKSIGIMGTTGRSTGTHLHFGLYYDENGDKQWIESEVVDPYGWIPPTQISDPWTVPSYPLWKCSLNEQQQIGTSGGRLTSPSETITVSVPPGTTNIPLLFKLWDSPPKAAPSAQLRSTGHTFWLQILEALAVTTEQNTLNRAISRLTGPMTISVTYKSADIAHLDANQLTLKRWDEAMNDWVNVPSTVDVQQNQVIAQTIDTGSFDLQAPLLCPADSSEPNDTYDFAQLFGSEDRFTGQSFDYSEDEDWFQLQATGITQYTIATENLANGVDTVLQVYDIDGVTMLVANDNFGGSKASQVKWKAPHDGVYFIRIIRSSASAYGCNATYELRITPLQASFLPIIRR